jgi:hypothetical protein
MLVRLLDYGHLTVQWVLLLSSVSSSSEYQQLTSVLCAGSGSCSEKRSSYRTKYPRGDFGHGEGDTRLDSACFPFRRSPRATTGTLLTGVASSDCAVHGVGGSATREGKGSSWAWMYLSGIHEVKSYPWILVGAMAEVRAPLAVATMQYFGSMIPSALAGCRASVDPRAGKAKGSIVHGCYLLDVHDAERFEWASRALYGNGQWACVSLMS